MQTTPFFLILFLFPLGCSHLSDEFEVWDLRFEVWVLRFQIFQIVLVFRMIIRMILNQILNKNSKYHFERSDHIIIGRRYAPQNYIYNWYLEWYLEWCSRFARTNGRRSQILQIYSNLSNLIVWNDLWDLYNLYRFVRFDFRFARRPMVLPVRAPFFSRLRRRKNYGTLTVKKSCPIRVQFMVILWQAKRKGRARVKNMKKKNRWTLIKKIKSIKRFHKQMIWNAMLDKTPEGGNKKI